MRKISLIIVAFLAIAHSLGGYEIKEYDPFYDGINYERHDYNSNVSNANWQGVYSVVDGGMRYVHNGVLDTSGHMLMLSNGMNATLSFDNGQIIRQFRTMHGRSLVYLTFLCKSNAGRSPKNTLYMHLLNNFHDPLFSVCWSNNHLWFKNSWETNQIAVPIPSTRNHSDGVLVCFAFERENSKSRYGVTLNPPLDSQPEIRWSDWSNHGLRRNVHIRDFSSKAPAGTWVAIDEIRFGLHPDEVGFKCPENDVNKGVGKELTESMSVTIESSFLKCIVRLKGQQTSSSGVVLRHGSNTYVYTNLESILHNHGIVIEDIHNNRCAIHSIECAGDRPLIRIRLRDPDMPVGTIDSRIGLNIPVAACGIRSDDGMFSSESGRITSLGLTEFETDIQNKSEYQGGPIVNVHNSIVGIAGYDWITSLHHSWNRRPNSFKLSAYRLDDIENWIPVSANWFIREASLLKQQADAVAMILAMLFKIDMMYFSQELKLTGSEPQSIRNWINDHNRLVLKHKGFNPFITKVTTEYISDLSADIAALKNAVASVFSVKTPQWHLPQFSEYWFELGKYETGIQKRIDGIKERSIKQSL